MAKNKNQHQQDWQRPMPQNTGQPQFIQPDAKNKQQNKPKNKQQNKAQQKPVKPKNKQNNTAQAGKKKKGSKPKLPSTQEVFPKFTNFHKNMWNHINSILAQQLPEVKTQKRRDISTAIMQTLIKNHYANPPQRQAFAVKNYDGMTPAEIAAGLDNSSATTLRRISDSYIPNIPTTIALIEQGWMRLPQLTDQGYEVLKEIDRNKASATTVPKGSGSKTKHKNV